MVVKSFIKLSPGVKIIKLFSFVTDEEAKEAGGAFTLGRPFQPNLKLGRKARNPP